MPNRENVGRASAPTDANPTGTDPYERDARKRLAVGPSLHDRRQTLHTGRIGFQSGVDGPRYEAILVTSGWVKQDDGEDSPWLIPADVLRDALDRGLFSGLPHYVDHPELFGFGWSQRPSVRDLAGVTTDARWAADADAVAATIRLYDTEAGQLLAALYNQLMADRQAGNDVPPLGLSIVCYREYAIDEASGARIWTRINKVCSVDAVYEPGAAGIIRQALSSAALESAALESAAPSTLRHDPTVLQPSLLDRGQSRRDALHRSRAHPLDRPDVQPVLSSPSLMAGRGQHTTGGSNVNEEQVPTNVEQTLNATEAPAAPLGDVADAADTNDAPPAVVDEPQNGDPAVIGRMQQNLAALNAAVERLNGLLAQREEQSTVEGMGDPPRGPRAGKPALYGGLRGIDQVQLAVEAMLTGTRPPQGVRPLTGIRELYMLLSGDYELTGRFHDDRVYLANVTTSTMAGIVADALNKVVVTMFREYDQWWAPAVTVRDFNSLQDVKWITLGGVGELPTVAEGQPYTELTWDDQKESDAFVKKGGYLGITIETIDKDDTGRVMAAPRALAQGAWLTLGKSIAEIFTSGTGGDGPTMSDGNQLFDNANHSNKGSSALSYAAWKATTILMMKFTELNSGERLGALTRPRFLWVPIDLEDTALEILAAGEGQPDDADYHVNPDALADGLTARTAAARRRVITVPFWTNTTDWVAQADPNLYPSIGLGFRYGRTPEVFSVADPRAGLMFTNDTMPIKVRFFYAVGPTDWRGLYKHDV